MSKYMVKVFEVEYVGGGTAKQVCLYRNNEQIDGCTHDSRTFAVLWGSIFSMLLKRNGLKEEQVKVRL